MLLMLVPMLVLMLVLMLMLIDNLGSNQPHPLVLRLLHMAIQF
jgi:hypothetical protein